MDLDPVSPAPAGAQSILRFPSRISHCTCIFDPVLTVPSASPSPLPSWGSWAGRMGMRACAGLSSRPSHWHVFDEVPLFICGSGRKLGFYSSRSPLLKTKSSIPKRIPGHTNPFSLKKKWHFNPLVRYVLFFFFWYRFSNTPGTHFE